MKIFVVTLAPLISLVLGAVDFSRADLRNDDVGFDDSHHNLIEIAEENGYKAE